MTRAEPVLVGDVMSSPVETISPDATVEAAASKMQAKAVSALLVTTSPAGIVTSTDVLDAVADGRDPTTLRVEDVMTASVESVTPDLQLEEAAAMMTNFGIKHLPVVDDDYVGMLSSSDITAYLS